MVDVLINSQCSQNWNTKCKQNMVRFNLHITDSTLPRTLQNILTMIHKISLLQLSLARNLFMQTVISSCQYDQHAKRWLSKSCWECKSTLLKLNDTDSTALIVLFWHLFFFIYVSNLSVHPSRKTAFSFIYPSLGNPG